MKRRRPYRNSMGRRAEKADDEKDDADGAKLEMSYDAEQEMRETERYLSKASFMDGRSRDVSDMVVAMHAQLRREGTNEKSFHFFRIDNCSNRSSIIYQQQYRAYCNLQYAL